MNIINNKIKNKKEFDDLVRKLEEFEKSDDKYLYRGQFNSEWNLESSYKREFRTKNNLADEDFIPAKSLVLAINEQIKYINNELEDKKNGLDILAELQHYGSPTLLIDFTSCFKNALWFAVSDINLKKEKIEYFELFYFKREKNIKANRTITILNSKEFYKCSDDNKYGQAQKSYFILDNSDFLKKKWNMESILISFELRDEILKYLLGERVNSRSIYPDLKGLYLGYQNYSEEALLMNGFQLIKTGKHQAGIKNFDEVLKFNPDSIEALCFKGNVLSELKKYDEGIVLYDKALKLNPNDPFSYNGKGCILMNKGNLEEADKYFDKAITLNPQISYFFSNKGLIYQKRKMNNKAIIWFKKALTLGPQNTEFYEYIGFILIEEKKYDEAIVYFNKGIELEPDNNIFYNNKGIALIKNKKNNEALECFNKALNLNPKDLKSLEEIAFIFMQNEKYNDALQHFNRILLLDPKNKDILFNKGNALWKKGKEDNNDNNIEVLNYIEKAIKLGLNESKVYFFKGTLLWELNNKNEALKNFDNGLKLEPNNIEIYYAKAIILLSMQKEYEGLLCLKKIIKLTPEADNTYLKKVIECWENKNYDEAIKNYLKIPELNKK